MSKLAGMYIKYVEETEFQNIYIKIGTLIEIHMHHI